MNFDWNELISTAIQQNYRKILSHLIYLDTNHIEKLICVLTCNVLLTNVFFV